MSKRRKLGHLLHDPIVDLAGDIWQDSLTFIETDNVAAARTRVAALMFIGRNNYQLTTTVRGNSVWIFKEKDFEGANKIVDLRRYAEA